MNEEFEDDDSQEVVPTTVHELDQVTPEIREILDRKSTRLNSSH